MDTKQITRSKKRLANKNQPVAAKGDNFVFVGWGGVDPRTCQLILRSEKGTSAAVVRS